MTGSSVQSKKVFQVGSVGVRVRSAPGLQGATLKYLSPGQSLQVDSGSRTEADGYVWWKHAEGWSAERNVDGSEVYLVESVPVVSPPPQRSAPVIDSTVDQESEEPSAKKAFQVGSVGVRVRSAPGLQGATVKYLSPGQSLQVDPGSRTEADGYVWWKHAEGWSAERSVDGSEVYLVESVPVTVSTPPASVDTPDGDKLPLLNELFKRLPVNLEQTQWWQYYGNNVFAYDLWREGKRWYKYAQGLHAGLDFGNSNTRGVLVRAGVEGVFHKHDTSAYRPNALWVKVGDYTLIYGHLTNPRSFQPGQPIGASTVLGEIEFGGQQHLHLEVRYQNCWIVNPLLLMPAVMREGLFQKFPPSGEYFYRGGGWTRWQTPLDQPMLKLSGELIGPHAM